MCLVSHPESRSPRVGAVCSAPQGVSVRRAKVLLGGVLLVPVFALVACESFRGAAPTTTELVDGSPGSEGAALDAAPGPVNGAAGDGGIHETFEEGAPCAGWRLEYSTASLGDPHGSGASSCRVCETSPIGDAIDIKLSPSVDIVVSPGRARAIRAAMWIRLASPGTAVGYISIHYVDELDVEVGRDVTSAQALTGEWRQFRIVGEAPATATRVKARFAAQVSDAACVDIDDVDLAMDP